MAKVLSMQVGEHIIRLAEIQVSGKSTQINKIYTFDIPDEATKDGKVRLSDEVVTSIRAGLIESNILTKDVYFAIESSRILFKSVEIPYVADKLIYSTLTLSLTDLFNVDDSLYHIFLSYMEDPYIKHHHIRVLKVHIHLHLVQNRNYRLLELKLLMVEGIKVLMRLV